MTSLNRAWNRFFFSSFDPLPLAPLRITLGILFLVMLCFLYPNWEIYYGRAGIPSLIANPGWIPPYEDWWSAFRWLDGIVSLKAIWWMGILTSIAFIIGFQTRIATILLYILQTSMIHRNLSVVNGEDLVFRMVLLYCCFLPLGDYWSVDSRLRKRNPPLRSAWALRLLQLNLLLIYAFSLPCKLLLDPTWLSGDAMYYVAINATWSRIPWPELFYYYPVSAINTYMAIIVEATLPILVWFKRTRPWAVANAMFFHVMISILLLNVTFFSLTMVFSFFALYQAEDIRRFENWLRRFLALQLKEQAHA